MLESVRVGSDDDCNQPAPYVDVDLYGSDVPLQTAVAANGGKSDDEALIRFGRHWGSAEMFELGRQANENVPKLKLFDARGARLDFIEFHPAYHALMADSIRAGLHASTWRSDGTAAAAPGQVTRAARFYMAAQVETGHLCPVTMTRAAVAALVAEPELAARFLPAILPSEYDARFRPWQEKAGVTIGMGMTERQGGTDVRTNTTRAVRTSEGYAVTGHKWFMSAPMCDGFLVLAQAPGGLTCLLMPRFRPDGKVNGILFRRLKDKLGNRSNASTEVDFSDAFAWRIGEEGRGVRTIINMVQLTRLDCAIASAGIMRMALAQALHHARQRVVFHKRLANQPMMQEVLADMALEVEAATALVLRLARSYDLASADPQEAMRARVLTPVVKYWVCKRAPALTYEAMECLGGNGYIEESLLARLYREAPVNAIWEGSGNVMCLDVLRARAQPGDPPASVLEAVLGEIERLPGAHDAVEAIESELGRPECEAFARRAVERLALLAATAALQAASPALAEIFARTRLSEVRGALFGTSNIGSHDARRILERALPDARP